MGRYIWTSSARSRASNDSSGRQPITTRGVLIAVGSGTTSPDIRSDMYTDIWGAVHAHVRQMSSGSQSTISTRQSITQPVPSTTSTDIMSDLCRHIWASNARSRVPNNSSGSQAMIRTRQIRSQVRSVSNTSDIKAVLIAVCSVKQHLRTSDPICTWTHGLAVPAGVRQMIAPAVNQRSARGRAERSLFLQHIYGHRVRPVHRYVGERCPLTCVEG
jgi:hypothetical protein